MDIILKYFPHLTETQIEQFKQLEPLYADWNAKINVISRKDFSEFYERHVLHSLGIAKFARFADKTKILDVGTGGGFPGIPLAILFPEVQFHLVDSIGKKIKVVNGVAESLGLKNVRAEQIRAEQLQEKYDYVVSRAVTRLPDFVKWIRKNISKKQINPLPNGVIYLKGGDLREEIKPFGKRIFLQELSDYFDEPFFETKKVLHLPL
ncbi:16S rRNA (guanine(527)-N(7))-methyltransferase RsmG [Draconibacterium sp. IB214405]|uniref:16S rRNA (guanine(527)-N(7))-methyltransferase RsmG n=1 Tax=Draconibacterium sp. IB214405 TaxID=3097352 RepID=UPI002A141D60|nr:16S rRNA (guanine(527)-N(7))-methyltransferase RsmG [Draconibacterium sp. IB214405]MDX8340849.1 16S rRNA (guanine(527)-N(7))-methyltransferase RsmG [Draconibacterium sp. IB214405]